MPSPTKTSKALLINGIADKVDLVIKEIDRLSYNNNFYCGQSTEELLADGASELVRANMSFKEAAAQEALEELRGYHGREDEG